MALVPRALQPKTVLRRAAIKRSGKGNSIVWRALGAYFIGGTALLRSRALRYGLGGSRSWLAIFVGVFLRSETARRPERISIDKLRTGQFENIRVETPMSAKQRKRSGITRKLLEQQAMADVAAAKAVDSAT